MKESRRSRKERSQETRAAIGKGLSIAASVLVFGGLAAGLTFGVSMLESRLAARPETPTAKVVFNWPSPGPNAPAATTWLPTSVQHDLVAAAQREIDSSPDPFSVAGIRRVAESAAGSGWFEHIRTVTREPGGTVRVDGEWRVPAAVVRRDNDYVIARKGEILPLAYDVGSAPLKAIVGASQDAAKAAGRLIPGQVWPGTDVRAGLDLLALLSTRPWYGQVAAIDVGDYAGKRQLSIVTKAGNRIVWGGGLQDTIPGQVSVEIRLRRLDVLQHQYGAIDARHRLVEVAGPRTLVDDTATADAS
jgi:hypothetical protein